MSLIIRSKSERVLSFGPAPRVVTGSIKLYANVATSVPENKLSLQALASIRSLAADGEIEVLDSEPAHGLNFQRPFTARNQLHIVLGTGSTGSVTLPNGSTLHVLTIGGVSFTLGNSNIDGANATTLLAAFVAALDASTDFADTGATVASSTVLAGDEKALVIIDAEGVADWDAFKAATTLKDDQGEDLGSPALTVTTFDATTEDSVLSTVPVIVTRTVAAGDVTRGYVALDTQLTSVSSYVLGITRSGSRLLHDGTVSVEDNRVVLIQNDSNTDFAAGDVITLVAFGYD
jgi:hypothetical protein